MVSGYLVESDKVDAVLDLRLWIWDSNESGREDDCKECCRSAARVDE